MGPSMTMLITVDIKLLICKKCQLLSLHATGSIQVIYVLRVYFSKV